MSEFAIAVIAAFFVFVILGIVYHFKRDDDGANAAYECTLCGETDCICHRGRDGH